MDVTVQWKISADVEKLVESVVECKKSIVKCAKQKYGKAKLLSCDAYAGDKVIELFSASDLWSPCAEQTEEDLVTPEWRQQKKTTELVADFSVFKLHRMSVLGEASVRVIVVFHVDENSAEQTWFGNIMLTNV